MFNMFREWLKEKGYSEFTPKGLLSTCTNYPTRIEYIIWYEGLSSWQDVVNNIDILLLEYSKGGKREEIGHKSHDSVINALRRFCEFLIENNIKPQKTKKLILKDKISEDYKTDEDVFEFFSAIYTIKFLNEDEIIKVTTDKNKESNEILYYNVEKSPLIQSLLGKNKGEILSVKTEAGNIVKVEIIDIEL